MQQDSQNLTWTLSVLCGVIKAQYVHQVRRIAILIKRQSIDNKETENRFRQLTVIQECSHGECSRCPGTSLGEEMHGGRHRTRKLFTMSRIFFLLVGNPSPWRISDYATGIIFFLSISLSILIDHSFLII